MGVSQSVISDMRHRGRTVTPETAIELADIAGENPLEAMADAVLERSKGTRREGVLREILGKALVTGVAAMSLFSYSDSAISGQVSTPKSETGVNKSPLVLPKFGLFARLRKLIRWTGNRLRPTRHHPQAGPVKTV
jgi:hypothetical protein